MPCIFITCSDHEPLQNVEFHNRLYMDSSIPDVDTLTRGDIDSVDTDGTVTGDDDGTSTRGGVGTATRDDGGTNIGRDEGINTYDNGRINTRCGSDARGRSDALGGSGIESRDNNERYICVGGGGGTITRDDGTSERRIITEQSCTYTVPGRTLPDYLYSLSSSATRETVNTGVYIDCLTTV